MSGVLWAAASGLCFGLFQAVNGRAVRDLDDVYVATFLQLAVAAAVSVAITQASGDLELIGELSAWGWISFTIAGAVHFFIGWTLLNLSHQRIGAARSSPLLASAPLWGIVIAAIVFSELPGAGAIVGILVMVAGALLVTSPASMAGTGWRDSGFAVATAFAWALSPIFTVEGLGELESPLLGVTIGLVASSVAFGLLLLLLPGTRERSRGLPQGALALKVACGVLVAFATWWRWEALDLTTVGAVLALNLLSVPGALILAPLIAGRDSEAVTAKVWAGSALVVAGSLLLIVLS